jgi:transposase
MAVRERVAAYVDNGYTVGEAARHCKVSKSFAESVIKTRNDTGSLQPRRQGNRIGGGRLVDHADFLRKRLKDNGNLTNDELCAELERRDVRVHPQTLKRMLKRQGLEAKKKLL